MMPFATTPPPPGSAKTTKSQEAGQGRAPEGDQPAPTDQADDKKHAKEKFRVALAISLREGPNEEHLTGMLAMDRLQHIVQPDFAFLMRHWPYKAMEDCHELGRALVLEEKKKTKGEEQEVRWDAIGTPSAAIDAALKRSGFYKHQRGPIEDVFSACMAAILAMQLISSTSINTAKLLDVDQAHLVAARACLEKHALVKNWLKPAPSTFRLLLEATISSASSTDRAAEEELVRYAKSHQELAMAAVDVLFQQLWTQGRQGWYSIKATRDCDREGRWNLVRDRTTAAWELAGEAGEERQRFWLPAYNDVFGGSFNDNNACIKLVKTGLSDHLDQLYERRAALYESKRKASDAEQIDQRSPRQRKG